MERMNDFSVNYFGQYNLIHHYNQQIINKIETSYIGYMFRRLMIHFE
jgi:hypothetical protein